MKRLLVQTQLSNIVDGRFDLACDSGWQMCINRCREMLRLDPELHVDVMVPYWDLDGQRQLVASVADVNPDLWATYGPDGDGRLTIIERWVEPSALATRYDFDWFELGRELRLASQARGLTSRYDAVYVNDPMQLRSLKALFHTVGGYQPKFFVHSHFVDLPEVPKFPEAASLWLGQCEAAIKADHNFWQCETAMDQFFASMGKWFNPDVVAGVRAKSTPWDDGYSVAEVTRPVDPARMRFTEAEWHAKTHGKVVLFFPNRISQGSSDYTRGWWFVHEFLPKLHASRSEQDPGYVVVCGNPNSKLSNVQLEELCGQHGYVKLHDHTLNRDEYRFVARHSDVVVALYDAQSDAYGGTASRECIELGCMPLWPDANEYSSIAREAGIDRYVLAKADMSDLVMTANTMITDVANDKVYPHPQRLRQVVKTLQRVVRGRCSYEATTPAAMKKMGLL